MGKVAKYKHVALIYNSPSIRGGHLVFIYSNLAVKGGGFY